MGVKEIQSLPPDWRVQRGIGFLDWFYTKCNGPRLSNDQVINIIEGFEP